MTSTIAPITTITKQNITDVVADIESKLAVLGQYYGLEFVLSRKKYTDETISFTVEGSIKNSPKLAKLLDDNLKYLGLPSDTIGSKVKLEGIIYTVTSVDPKMRAYPVMVKNSNNQTYKISVQIYKSSRV